VIPHPLSPCPPTTPWNPGLHSCFPGALTPSHHLSPCRKLFIGGITVDTTEIDLKEHFEKFGILTDVVVMRSTPPPSPQDQTPLQPNPHTPSKLPRPHLNTWAKEVEVPIDGAPVDGGRTGGR